MSKLFFILLLVTCQVFAASSREITQQITNEWKEFYHMVNTLEADGDVGGYMFYKDFPEVTLLWRTSEYSQDNEVIRLFLLRPTGIPFTVTYHKSHIIVPGRVVLRRFIGPEPTGWINHTIDFDTQEYLGSQGFAPKLSQQEVELLEKWKIEFFE